MIKINLLPKLIQRDYPLKIPIFNLINLLFKINSRIKLKQIHKKVDFTTACLCNLNLRKNFWNHSN